MGSGLTFNILFILYFFLFFSHLNTNISHLIASTVTSSEIQITPVNLNLVSRSHFFILVSESKCPESASYARGRTLGVLITNRSEVAVGLNR